MMGLGVFQSVAANFVQTWRTDGGKSSTPLLIHCCYGQVLYFRVRDRLCPLHPPRLLQLHSSTESLNDVHSWYRV